MSAPDAAEPGDGEPELATDGARAFALIPAFAAL